MKILYDPVQHFHTGFHKPMIDYPPGKWNFSKGHINYFFRKEMSYGKDNIHSKEVLMIGEMKGDGDLVFSPHTLITNSKKWVVDLEHVDWLFMNAYLDVPEREYIFDWKVKIANSILASDSCKAILCRSKFAISSIDGFFKSRKISEKCVLFYPVQPMRPYIQASNKNLTLGFIISSYADYYRKGGDIAIKVFQKLRQRYENLQLVYVGLLPPKKLFFNPENIPGLIHYANIPHEEVLSKILPSIDILLFPSRADTFGTVVLEAMSFGKPVVANVGRHIYGLKEVLRNGENSVTVNLPDDNLPIHANTRKIDFPDLLKKTDLLIKNSELRLKIGNNARKYINKNLSTDSMGKILKKLENRFSN